MSKSLKIVVAAVVIAGGISSVANADGYEYEPVTDYAPAPPVFSWTGTYGGFNAGWIRSETTYKRTGLDGVVDPANNPGIDALIPGSVSGDSDGFMAGLTLGYNQRMGASFVAGIESDIAYTDIDGGNTTTLTGINGAGFLVGSSTVTTSLSTRMQWFGTLRARAGWLASRDLLIYATGGLAYANLENRLAQTFVSNTFPAVPAFFSATSSSGSDWKTGWTVGGGMEWLMGNKTTLKGEYLYYDLDDSTISNTSFSGAGTTTYKSENKGHIVRMGLNVAMY